MRMEGEAEGLDNDRTFEPFIYWSMRLAIKSELLRGMPTHFNEPRPKPLAELFKYATRTELRP